MKKAFHFLFITLFLIACINKSKNEVVVYTSVDQVFSEPVLKEFEKQTGIKVNAVF
jgi:iron(III) transport system substrate-binding protein